MQRLKLLLAILVLLSIAGEVRGQWTRNYNALNTRPTQLLEVNSKIIVSDDFGLAYSVDNGVHWKRTKTDTKLARCTTEGDQLYAISQDGNSEGKRILLRSANAGESWDTLAAFAIPQPTRMVKVDYFFYFMTQQGGIATVDVFDVLASQLTQLGAFTAVFPDPQNAYELMSIGTNVFFASDWGLIRYKNGGSQIDTLTNTKVTMIAVKGDTLFSNTGYDFKYSSDLGQTWTNIPFNNNLPYSFLKALYFKGNKTYLLGTDAYNSCSDVKLWETNDSFTQGIQKLRLRDGVCVNDLLICPNGALVITTPYHGILTLDPADQTWFINNSGLGTGNFKVSEQDDFLLAGNLISRDSGQTWTYPLMTPTYFYINSMVKKDSFYYAAVSYGGLWKSADCKHWVQLVDWVPHINKVGNYLMTTTADERIQLSTDGLNWITTPNRLQQSHFPPNQIQGNIIYNLRFDPNFNQVLFQSTHDLGATWQNPGLGFLISSAESFQEIFAAGANVYLVTFDPQTLSRRVYASHDYGHNWQLIPLPTNTLSGQSLACTDNLLIATDLENIWVTANDGETWTTLDRDTFAGPITTLDIALGKLWVSTNDELWTRNLNEINLEVYKGTVFNDQNFNAIRDNAEAGIPHVILKVSNRDWQVVTDSLGRYEIKAELINDSISVIKPIQYAVAIPNTIAADSSHFNNNDFAIQIEPDITDVSVTAVNSQIFRPGFETDVFVSLRNEGTRALDSVQLVLPALDALSRLQLVDVVPSPSLITGDTLIWNNLSIALFGQKDIRIRYKTRVDINLSNLAALTFIANQSNDADVSDNVYTLFAPVLGSFDPNDKRVQPDTVPPAQLAQTDLHYTIRFQNTGNYRADFVTILDTMPIELDLSTLKILSASHPFTWQIKNGRVLAFHFNPINLPDSTSDEAGSHGFVQFAVRAKQDLQSGKIIDNRAAIYFDYNAPVLTDYAKMYVKIPVSATHEPYLNDPISISPNPAKNIVIVEKKAAAAGILEIYHADGRLVFQQSTTQQSVAVTITDWPNGLYFVAWKMAGGRVSGKFLKQ